MRYFGLLDPRLWQREGERWIDARPPGPDDGRDPEPIACGNSRMVVARDERVFGDDGRPNSGRLRELFATGLLALTGQSSEPAAWRSLMPGLAVGDVVGLKINTVADVAAKNIVVWDNLGRLGPLRRAFYGNLERPEGAYYQGMPRAFKNFYGSVPLWDAFGPWYECA